MEKKKLFDVDVRVTRLDAILAPLVRTAALFRQITSNTIK